MFEPTDFYSGFQVNHFKYKLLTSKYFLGLSDTQLELLADTLSGRQVKDFRLSLQIDIRMNLLFAIETLFELMFSLLPDPENKIDDSLLLFRLAEKKQYYEQIRKFGNYEPSNLDKLQERFAHPDGFIYPFARHIFYCGVPNNQSLEMIQSSLTVIDNYLRTFAKELSNREELNSYKHGFRGVPMVKKLTMAKPETREEILSFDLGNSITIFSKDKKTNIHTYETKGFDSERDEALTYIASDLIANIINARKARFSKTGVKLVEFSFFDEITQLKSCKPNEEVINLKVTVRPEKD